MQNYIQFSFHYSLLYVINVIILTFNELQVPQTDVTNEEIINNTASLTNTERYDGIIMHHNVLTFNELQVPQTDVTNEEIINNTASLTNTERYDGIIMYHNTTLPDHYNSLFYKADLRPLIDQAK